MSDKPPFAPLDPCIRLLERLRKELNDHENAASGLKTAILVLEERIAEVPKMEAATGPFTHLTTKQATLQVLAAHPQQVMSNEEILREMSKGGWESKSLRAGSIVTRALGILVKEGEIQREAYGRYVFMPPSPPDEEPTEP